MSSIRETTQAMPACLGVTMVAADGNSGQIERAVSARLVGKTLEEIEIDLKKGGQGQMRSGSVDGKRSYYKAHNNKGYINDAFRREVGDKLIKGAAS